MTIIGDLKGGRLTAKPLLIVAGTSGMLWLLGGYALYALL